MLLFLHYAYIVCMGYNLECQKMQYVLHSMLEFRYLNAVSEKKEESIRDVGEKTDEILLVILRTHIIVFILPLQ